jgi:hypothetical protein
MTSVADDVRRSLRERVRAMSPEERLALAARLAESDLALFLSARRLTRDAARRLLIGRRQIGRRPSRVMRRGSV